MPSFSKSLETALHRALEYANDRNHEYATLEHLLLALVDDRDASAVMRACSVDIDALRGRLTEYLDTELVNLVAKGSSEAQPTTGFQRVIHRAVVHVQSSGREEVTGANVLVAIFAERESHAAYFLQEQDMSRYDAVNYIAHGIAKKAGQGESRTTRGTQTSSPSEDTEDKAGAKKGEEALDAYCVNLNIKAREGKVDPLIGRAAGDAASRVAFHPPVREALLALQKDFAAQPGGAVLDGRDIGTVIAPEADVKIYVTADPEVRAERRWKQLVNRGEMVAFETILEDIRERDARDAGRDAAPMVAAQDAVLLDTSDLAIDAAFEAACRIVEEARARKG